MTAGHIVGILIMEERTPLHWACRLLVVSPAGIEAAPTTGMTTIYMWICMFQVSKIQESED